MNKFKQFSIAVFLTIAVIPSCFPQNYFSANGGSDIRLAIYEPQPQGDVPKDQLNYVQGMLNNNFNKFSAIRLTDQQYLDKIVDEQNLAASGRFSDEDYIRIGALVNAQYLLFGTLQSLSGNRYRLQLSITDASGGIRKATFMKEGRISALVYEATEELLKGLDVNLTAEGRSELQKQQREAVQAEQKRENEEAKAARAAERDAKGKSRYAERSFVGAGVFGQFTPGLSRGAGLEIEAYAPIIPFVTTGVSGKAGFLALSDGNEQYKDKDENAFTFSISPVIGVVWPANKSVKVFADVLFDFGRFGYFDGIFTEWLTMSYDVGIQFHIPNKKYAFGLKYQGSFYEDKETLVYSNLIGVGISLWWEH